MLLRDEFAGCDSLPLYQMVYHQKTGQGVVEYAGAMIVAAIVVATIAASTRQGNWMFNAYQAIITASGSVITNAAGTLQ